MPLGEQRLLFRILSPCVLISSFIPYSLALLHVKHRATVTLTRDGKCEVSSMLVKWKVCGLLLPLVFFWLHSDWRMALA